MRIKNTKFWEAFHSSQVEHYILFLLAMALFGIARGMFVGVQDNFLAWLGIDRSGRGVVEFFREIPGLLLIFILSLFYRMAEQNILRISMLICVAGVTGMLLAANNVYFAILSLVIFNLGDHIIMPVRQSYAIHASAAGREGRALGFLRSLTSMGEVTGMIMAALIFLLPRIQGDQELGGRLGYSMVYGIAIAVLGLTFFAALRMARSTGKLERKRIYFHRKFNKYYILEIFYGGRKQIFLTFAPYLLILEYGAGVTYIAGILGICSLINIVINLVIGRLIDKLGYRKVMIGDTIILFFACLAYGFAHRIFDRQTAFVVVSAVFVLDRMISNAAMAASVYVGRISRDKEEMTATLTTGLSVNHLVTIFIALSGGVIWEHVGIELLFSLAALMAAANSLFACWVPKIDPVPAFGP